MIEGTTLRWAWVCIAVLAVGCSSPSGPKDQAAVEASSPKPDAADIQAAAPVEPPRAPNEAATEVPISPAAPVEATPAPAVPPPPEPATAAAPAPQSAPAPAPAPIAPPPAPAAAPASTAAVIDPGGPVAVAATKSGLSRVGSDQCETCHEEQFASWAQGAHAARKPPLGCEDCHGPGSAYRPMAVMKDPARARAAGLVIPDQSFCSTCHARGVTADFMKQVHAGNDPAG